MKKLILIAALFTSMSASAYDLPFNCGFYVMYAKGLMQSRELGMDMAVFSDESHTKIERDEYTRIAEEAYAYKVNGDDWDSAVSGYVSKVSVECGVK